MYFSALGYYERLVSVVYNLAYVQALLHVSCKFNEEERLSWINRNSRKPSAAGSRRTSTSSNAPPSTGIDLLQTLIKHLTTINFYPSEDATVSVRIHY